MVELEYTADLGSAAERLAGSTPVIRTMDRKIQIFIKTHILGMIQNFLPLTWLVQEIREYWNHNRRVNVMRKEMLELHGPTPCRVRCPTDYKQNGRMMFPVIKDGVKDRKTGIIFDEVIVYVNWWRYNLLR